jgi:hypothetical protein
MPGLLGAFGDHNKRDGITPRELVIPPPLPKDRFRLRPHRLIIGHQTERRFHSI